MRFFGLSGLVYRPSDRLYVRSFLYMDTWTDTPITSDRSREIPNWTKTPTNNEKIYKESNEKKYHQYEGHGEHALQWVIHKLEDYSGPKKKQKEY